MMTFFLIMKFAILTVILCLVPKIVSSQSLHGTGTAPAAIDSPHQLSPGQPTELSIGYRKNSTLTLTLKGVSPRSRFVIVQAYSQHATLVMNQTSPEPGAWRTGRGVGMVQGVSQGVTSGLVWTVGVVRGSVREQDFPVSVLALVQEYGEGAPMPGGCNQVFPLETDPNVEITPKLYHSQVWFQWANVTTPAGERPASCEDRSAMSRLSYDVYVSYVAETDDSVSGLFHILNTTSATDTIHRHAVKVHTIKNDGQQKSVVKVTSQQGQGSVVWVVVKDSVSGGSALYVAGVSYACNYTAGDCDLRLSTVEWVVMVPCAVAGLILLLLGHQFLKTEMAVSGFMAVTLVSFILLSMVSTLSDPVRLSVSAGLGLVGGGGWLALWMVFSFPSVSVLLPGLCAGFLLAGTLFFTPFANISWWNNSLNYGLVLLCITLMFGVVFLCSPRTLNIVSCGVVGGYCVVMVAAIPLRSSLRLVVLFVVRHAAVSDFASFLTVPPFLTNDIILAVVWAVLAMTGAGWQFYRARGHPHFPPSSSSRRRRLGRSQVRGQGRPPSDLRGDDERAPLLGNNQRRGMNYHHDSIVHHPPPSTPSAPPAPETSRPM